jgi:hypothetical protein
MAYVDETSVAAAMVVLLGGTGLTFKAEPAEDGSVDASVAVLLHGKPTDFSVQVGGGYTCLNEYLYRGESREPGELVASRHHGSWGVCRDDMRALATALQNKLLVPANA